MQTATAPRKATKKQSPRTAWLRGFYTQDCCGVQVSGGYDVVGLMCRHNDYSGRETNAHYAQCNGYCGNIETLCEACVTEAVEDAAR